MTKAGTAVLAELRLCSAGRIVLAGHARERMAERGATFEDVRHALANATACKAQPNGRWRVTGPDLDGDELVLVVVPEAGVVVITVF
jgi:hypothetical protein